MNTPKMQSRVARDRESPVNGGPPEPRPVGIEAAATAPVARGGAAARAALVVVWSSGFISGTLGLRHAAPFTFACLRFVIAGGLLLAIALARGVRLPRGRPLFHLAVAGVLVQGLQFSSIYVGMDLGVPSGVAALVIALYPLVASLIAVPVLGEHITRGQVLGLALGLGGVVLAVWDRLHVGGGHLAGIAFLFLGLLGISAGTVWQKLHCQGMEPVSGNAVQLIAAAAATLVPALLAEGFDVTFAAGFWPVLLWAALINSIVGVGLLYHLLQRDGTSQVSSLFYLVPMVTAAFAAVLLHQDLGPLTLGGLALATGGTLLANRIGHGARRSSGSG
ncbi:DMT family transporter [Streptomyces endophyticus]|uniref:DMT family transporter n=1 Tax=Streptomyces endophyticus TaxID=714166 RepID=A0ABU6F886_9ACTN|nr:DMT family transporter [Streptomyces endophyticus]MEB8340238.1 DMT family transporter [Streptomyces endophyticus]